MGRATVPRLVEGHLEAGRCLVCGRARSPLPWQPDRSAQTPYISTAIVPAGDHRLLGQRHPGPAVLRGRTTDRPGTAGSVAERHCALTWFPTNQPTPNSRPTAIARFCDPVRPRRVQPEILQGCGRPTALPASPTTNIPRTTGRLRVAEIETTLPNGERVLKLAERGTWIRRPERLWVRETRKLTTSGHQVSLISSAFGQSSWEDCVRLFSRWSQENFFRYMIQHFAIDLLNEYGTEEIPETKRPVVNPKRRELDRQKRSIKSRLTHRQASFAALTVRNSTKPHAGQVGETQSGIGRRNRTIQTRLADIDDKLKTTPSHLAWDELPEAEKFQRLAPSRKQLVDTVKMIAYRGTRVLASIVREKLAGQTTPAACCVILALRPTWYPIWNRRSCAWMSIRCQPRDPTARHRAPIGHLNAAELPYPQVPIYDSSTRSPV